MAVALDLQTVAFWQNARSGKTLTNMKEHIHATGSDDGFRSDQVPTATCQVMSTDHLNA